ncbi:YceI family protein [Confluentibacter lentus]|uniref:YceI family protein n=1 Tax=Confluentibacter lentus TaxID=1699412 RepID=UPI000C281DEB|nr:YceI family protein [Confluentibacter lentus]
MKRILIFITVITALAFTDSFVGSTSVIIAPNSKLLINVKTNVNSFKCQYDILKLNKPIPIFFKNHGKKISFEKATLILDNVNFDCGGPGINNDFKELLKTKTYPKIFINLREINKDQNNEGLIHALVNLEIAGVTKSYTVPVELKDEGTLSIKGVLALNIRDFNLEPPKKALGLIVVKDVIEINFELAVKKS